MREPDANDYLEWLYLEMDGELSAGERGRLERHLEADPAARRERAEVERLGRLLDEERLAVPPDFTARVMASLPAAGWESRHPRAWSAALALLALLLAAAAAVGGVAVAAGEPVAGLLGAASAVAALFAASLAAGAGLLGASWQGIGLALAGVLGRSPVNWVAFAILVVGVNLLLLRLLRRPVRQGVRR